MKTSLPIRFLFGIWLFLLFSCEKEINYPEIKTEPLIALSNSSFVASAKVISKGEFKIIDHGFIYYLGSEFPNTGGFFPTDNKISLGNLIENDTFAVSFSLEDIDYYYDNLKCFVKAYITDERGTVYANYVYRPILQVKVSVVSPQVGGIGDTISITGENFTVEPSANSVKFGNINAVIVSAASNELKVVVPEGVVSDYWDNSVSIQIISGGQTININGTFRLAASPTGFQPNSGSWGDMITIYGSAFHSCEVYFDNVPIGNISTSNGYINVSVPYDLLLKKFKIYIQSGGAKIEVPGGLFTMDDLVINPLNNLVYFPGSTIVFSGEGINPYTSRNQLFLGQSRINADNYSQCTFTIPGSIAPGEYPVVISNGLDTAVLSDKIEIIKPVITGISVNSGYPGSEVIVSGTNLILENNIPSISFEPYNFSPVSLSPTQIIFNVPHVASGDYAMSAYYYGGFSVPFPWDFTVLEPEITSIEPTSGNAGSSIVIYGNGFHFLNYTAVYFGNVKAEIMSGTNTQLNVKVPSGLTSGVWMVKVYIDNSELSSSAIFTVP